MSKKVVTKGPRRLDAAIDEFGAHGPYTFEAALKLARRCARGNRLQIGDTLDRISYKFPLPEFIKLLDVSSGPHAETWKAGAENWRCHYLSRNHTDAQLQELAKRRNLWDGILDRASLEHVPEWVFLSLLRGLAGSAKESSRDDSAERS